MFSATIPLLLLAFIGFDIPKKMIIQLQIISSTINFGVASKMTNPTNASTVQSPMTFL